MKTIDKTVNLSQTKAKSMFKKYATSIVKILKSKGVKMIRKDNNDNSCWLSYRNKNKYARADVTIFYHNMNNEFASVDLLTIIHYPDYLSNKTDLEAIIRRRWSLLNRYISVSKKNPKIPILKPAKEVAEQFYLALKHIDILTK